jgi:hypothetical protein
VITATGNPAAWPARQIPASLDDLFPCSPTFKEEAMFPGKKILTATMSFAVVMAILVAGLGAAETTHAAPPIQEAAPQSTAIPYAGQLNDAAGQPVADGVYDFNFSLYDAPEGGNLLWTGTQSGVKVAEGSFSASLGSGPGLPKSVFDRKECWLAVSVRGPGEAGFTALEPRQLLPTDGPAAVSALSCPHSHFTDSWSGSNPDWGLLLENTSTGDGLRAYSKATAWNYAAVFGANIATTGYGTGVYGYSTNGLGMRAGSGSGDGIEAVTDTTGGKSAVYAHSDKGNGVWAVSGSAVGVHGSSTSSYGVEGYSTSNIAGWFEGSNNAGAWIQTDDTANWIGLAVTGILRIFNGSCQGCALAYLGQNDGTTAIEKGDLVAAAGVEVDPDTQQLVLLVRRATSADDAVIGVAVGAAAPPSEVNRSGPATVGKSGVGVVASGEYVQVMISGLAQVRVGSDKISVGEHLGPGADGAIAAADTSTSVARVLSAPDANGLAWAMVNAR